MIFNFECLIFDLRRAPATGGGIGIFNFGCFSAVAGHVTAGVGRAHARLRVDF